jgi:hypothetical protein
MRPTEQPPAPANRGPAGALHDAFIRPAAPPTEVTKLAINNGQIVAREHPSGISYGIRLARGGWRVYLALGHERDGWTRELADSTLVVVTAACHAQRAACCTQRRRSRWRG